MSVLGLKENLVKLPSQGKCYDLTKLPLINGDSVKVRPLVAGDQRYLAGTGGDPYLFYTTLLNRVVLEPKNVSFDCLLMDDVKAILYGNRILSYGEAYHLAFNCDNCQQFNDKEFSLYNVPTVDADEVEGDFAAYNLEFELDAGKSTAKKATAHLGTLGDEKYIAATLTAMRQKGDLKNENLDRGFVRLAQAIDTLDGETLPMHSKFAALEMVSNETFDEFGEFLVKKGIGIQPTISLECARCNFANEVGLAITHDFFRPPRRN